MCVSPADPSNAFLQGCGWQLCLPCGLIAGSRCSFSPSPTCWLLCCSPLPPRWSSACSDGYLPSPQPCALLLGSCSFSSSKILLILPPMVLIWTLSPLFFPLLSSLTSCCWAVLQPPWALVKAPQTPHNTHLHLCSSLVTLVTSKRLFLNGKILNRQSCSL